MMELNYYIKKYSIQEYRDLGGIPQKHFDFKTEYFLAILDKNIIAELAFSKNFIKGCGKDHYFILDTKSYIEKQGIGTALVSSLESHAIKNDISMIQLKFLHNSNANFWESRGYAIDIERKCAWRFFNQTNQNEL